MKRLGKTLVVTAFAALACAQTGQAEVTRSDNNDPRLAIGDQMQALLGSEKTRLRALPPPVLDTIASGPAVAPKPVAEPRAEKTARKTAKLPEADLVPMEPVFAPVVKYDAAWLMTLPEPAGNAEWQCLSEAIYFESRGETLKGQFAVAEVILNRRDSGLYPRSVCGVVHQRGGGGCQFSYACDGYADNMREPGARAIARRIARVMLDGAPRLLTDGATHFHTRGVSPGWAKRFPRTAAIGAHLFYRQPGASGG